MQVNLLSTLAALTNKPNLTKNEKVQALQTLSKHGVVLPETMLKSSDAGDLINIRILSLKDGQAIIKLPDGNVVQATGVTPGEVEAGDDAVLIITAKGDDNVVVEIFKSYDYKLEKDAKAFLRAFNMSSSKENINIVKAMLASNVLVEQESILEIKDAVLNKGLSLDDAVFLKANNMELTPENAKLLSNMNREFFAEQFSTLTDTPPKSTPAEQNPQNINHSNLETGELMGTQELDVNISINPEQTSNGSIIGRKTFDNPFSFKNSLEPIIDQIKELLSEPNERTSLIIDGEERDTPENIEKDAAIGREVSNILKELPPRAVAYVMKQIIPMLKYKQFENIDLPLKGFIGDIFQKEPFDDTMTTKELMILSEMSKAERNQDDFSATLKFSENFTTVKYLPIPVNINNHDTVAELYVLRDSRSKRKLDPKNISFFLSLSTANLDNVEAYIRAINNSVECEFRVKEEEIEFFKKNITPLFHMVESVGYRLTHVGYRKNWEEVKVVTAIKTKREIDKRFSFDTKI